MNGNTSHEQLYEATKQIIEAYKYLMLGDPVTFAIGITGAWLSYFSGSLAYWKES